MLKYHSTYIGFREIPDEISLCINISNCKNNCKGCHSPFLSEDIGTPLTIEELSKLVKDNDGITCVCFMGGDIEPSEINKLGEYVVNLGLKSAWYSGKKDISEDVDLKHFNFIKVGPYIADKGPLDNPNTNQRLYMIYSCCFGTIQIDITHKFWYDSRN